MVYFETTLFTPYLTCPSSTPLGLFVHLLPDYISLYLLDSIAR